MSGMSNMEENSVKFALFQKNYEFEVWQLVFGKFELMQSHYAQIAWLMLIWIVREICYRKFILESHSSCGEMFCLMCWEGSVLDIFPQINSNTFYFCMELRDNTWNSTYFDNYNQLVAFFVSCLQWRRVLSNISNRLEFVVALAVTSRHLGINASATHYCCVNQRFCGEIGRK